MPSASSAEAEARSRRVSEIASSGTGHRQPRARARTASPDINAEASSRGDARRASTSAPAARATGLDRPPSRPAHSTIRSASEWPGSSETSSESRTGQSRCLRSIRAIRRQRSNISPAGPEASPGRVRQTASRISASPERRFSSSGRPPRRAAPAGRAAVPRASCRPYRPEPGPEEPRPRRRKRPLHQTLRPALKRSRQAGGLQVTRRPVWL